MKFFPKKSVVVELPKDYPQPDLDTLRRSVEADSTNVRAKIGLAAHLQTVGPLDDAYKEWLEAISLLSNSLFAEGDARRLPERAFARRMAAKTLEEMGRVSDAREQWQGCAEDWRASVPNETYLHNNPLYAEAIAKLK